MQTDEGPLAVRYASCLPTGRRLFLFITTTGWMILYAPVLIELSHLFCNLGILIGYQSMSLVFHWGKSWVRFMACLCAPWPPPDSLFRQNSSANALVHCPALLSASSPHQPGVAPLSSWRYWWGQLCSTPGAGEVIPKIFATKLLVAQRKISTVPRNLPDLVVRVVGYW